MYKACGIKDIQKTILLLGKMNSTWELTLREYKLENHDFFYIELIKNFVSLLIFYCLMHGCTNFSR